VRPSTEECSNQLGQFIRIPSKCWHHGYFNDEANKSFITAQLFARLTINEDTERFSCSFTEAQEFIDGQLKYSSIKDLSDDLL
jgi:hypothetical protein